MNGLASREIDKLVEADLRDKASSGKGGFGRIGLSG
jgi:hypothetical protein